MRCLLAFAALLLFSVASAAPLPREAAVPGGVAIVPLGAADQPRPEATFNGRNVLVTQSEDQWLALVGLGLSTQAGTYHVESGDQRIAFQVAGKSYPEQRLTVSNPRHVTPNADDLKRIQSERVRIRAALETFSPHKVPAALRMPEPVTGRYSSPFGLQRFFNDQPRNPHSGLDIAAPTGTPILAPGPGRVVEAGDFFFNGKTVFIDHGLGLVTMYCHLDEIDVAIGDWVELGDPIGTVGETGRVTGPHLHWSIALNGTLVDPELFLVGSRDADDQE